MRKLEFLITNEEKIKHFLMSKFTESRVNFLIKTKGIYLNEIQCTENKLLKSGDRVKLIFIEDAKNNYKPKNMNLKTYYEDEDILIIYKPKQVAVMPTNKYYEDNVFCGLKYLFPNQIFRVVTRLDRDTDGLMVLAKNSLAHSMLSVNIKQIERKYTAIVHGNIENDIIIDAPIDIEEGIKRCVKAGGKRAVTFLKVLKCNNNDTSTVELQLETGRTHQIRVHMAYIGHAVVGDTLYGDNQGEYNTGQQLTCTYIKFLSPITKIPIELNLNKSI